MDLKLSSIQEKEQLTLQKLSIVTTPIWTEYNLKVKVKQIVKTMSKENKDYELVLVSDTTGSRILYNCANVDLEIGRNYSLRVRASQNKRSMLVTCFVLSAVLLHTAQNLEGQVDFEKKVCTMVLPELVGTIERISTVLNPEEEFSLDLNPTSSKDSDLDLLIKNTSSHKYYYRVWANDQTIDRSKLEEGTIICFRNISVSKKQDSNNVNLSKNKLSSITLDSDNFE